MYDLVVRKLATCFVMGMGFGSPESGLTFLYAVSKLFRVALISGSFKFQVLSFKLKTDKITDAALRWLVFVCEFNYSPFTIHCLHKIGTIKVCGEKISLGNRQISLPNSGLNLRRIF